MVCRPWPYRTEIKQSVLFHLTKGLWILISSSSSSQRCRSWWHHNVRACWYLEGGDRVWQQHDGDQAEDFLQEADYHLLHRSHLTLTLIGGSSQLAFLLWGILVFVFKTWTQFRLLWICHCLLVWKKSTSLVFLFYFTPVLCERETLRTLSSLSLHWIWILSVYRYHWEGAGACRLRFVFCRFKGDHNCLDV